MNDSERKGGKWEEVDEIKTKIENFWNFEEKNA